MIDSLDCRERNIQLIASKINPCYIISQIAIPNMNSVCSLFRLTYRER